MKKLIVLVLVLLVSLLPVTALAKASDRWICSDCQVWVSGEYCPQCTRQRPAYATDEECLLNFEINYEKNIYFAKYDVEVLVNGKRVFTIGHGQPLSGTVIVPKGMCEIVFRYAHNYTCDVRFMMNITRDETTFSADLVSHVLYFTMENIVSDTYIGDYMLSKGRSGILDGVSMQVLSVTESRGNSTNKPADGYVFVFVEFEVVNQRTIPLTIKDENAFRCYCDGYTIQTSVRAAAVSPFGFDRKLNAGERMKGMLCFELPNNWRELRIVYGNIANPQENLTFRVTD